MVACLLKTHLLVIHQPEATIGYLDNVVSLPQRRLCDGQQTNSTSGGKKQQERMKILNSKDLIFISRTLVIKVSGNILAPTNVLK